MESDRARIIANGKERLVRLPCTIADFLSECDLKVSQVVVEHNGTVLSKPACSTTSLGDGDRLEVIVPVAGG